MCFFIVFLEQAQSNAENELINARLQEAYTRVRQLESQLTERSSECLRLQHEASNLALASRSHPSKETNSVELQLRDSKIALLEREVKTVTEELGRCRAVNQQLEKKASGLTSHPGSGSSLLQDKELELCRSQERVLKQRVEAMRLELATKETEVLSIKTKVEALESQMTDQIQHVNFLKEQLAAKDNQQQVIQSDLEAAHERLRERDCQLEKKAKMLLQAQQERRKFENDVMELRDHVDIKEKKISVLQKKVCFPSQLFYLLVDFILY